MAPSSEKSKKRSCCTKNCSERVDPSKLPTKSRKDIVLKNVNVHPCKTRKNQDRIRPKNCYREYYLPGYDGKNIKICKNIFMKTVRCSSDFISKTLKEDIINKQGVEYVKEPVHQSMKGKTLYKETSGKSQASSDQQGLTNIPLMVEELNNNEESCSTTSQRSQHSEENHEENDIDLPDIMGITEENAFEAANFIWEMRPESICYNGSRTNAINYKDVFWLLLVLLILLAPRIFEFLRNYVESLVFM